jgi:hypothetical protein
MFSETLKARCVAHHISAAHVRSNNHLRLKARSASLLANS